MSSLRNAVQRRNHKERSQPHERSKWGLLEKHKDYSLRAKDHNAKKRKIKALQQKASERNEDEFYFGMMSSKTRGGIKVTQRGENNAGGQQGAGKSLSYDVVKLMKTQDSTYLQTVLQSTKRAVERLEKEVTTLAHGVPLATSTRKVVFAEYGIEDQPSQEVIAVSEESLNALSDLSEQDHIADDSDEEAQSADKVASKKQHTLDVKRRQLETLRGRQRSLTTALREVEDQRARMNGTTGGINKSGVRFKSRLQRR